MIKTYFQIAVLFFLLHGSSTATEAHQVINHVDEHKIFIEKLDNYVEKYKKINKNSESVKQLFLLDTLINQTIRDFVKSHRNFNHQEYWKKEYRLIGVDVGHYSEQFEYSRKLLVEVHKLNPNSKYREYSLHTTIVGEIDPSGLGMMPNIEKANQYIVEFPNGPYIDKVYYILATFYDDYYKVMKYLVSGKPLGGYYKEECFQPYFSNQSYNEQMLFAQKKGIEFYKKAAVAYSKKYDKDVSYYFNEEISNMKKGSGSLGWHWCAD